MVTTGRGSTAQEVLTRVTVGVVAYPAPFSSIRTLCISIVVPAPVVSMVAFAGMVGLSIVRVGLPTQKPPDNVIPVTTPFATVAVAVGFV